MTDKEKQRELIVEIMKADEQSGLYDEPKKQTAVDWLFNRLWETPKDKLTWYAILEEAKQREKMQIESAHRHGASDLILHRYKMEQYYKETYGENQEDKRQMEDVKHQFERDMSTGLCRICGVSNNLHRWKSI